MLLQWTMYWHSDTHVIWMLIFWVVVIGTGAVGLRYALGHPRGFGGGGRRGGGESPEDILKKRYARGEIDHDEFESRLDDLRK